MVLQPLARQYLYHVVRMMVAPIALQCVVAIALHHVNIPLVADVLIAPQHVVAVLQAILAQIVQVIALVLAKMNAKRDVLIHVKRHVLIPVKEPRLASPQQVQSMDMSMWIWG